MSSDVAIRVEKLGKCYRIGGRREPYKTLRDTLTRAAMFPVDAFRTVVRRGSHAISRRSGEIWALKDLSFEVRRGEVLGIIGRNGAGKSTLLKILSRITEPTTGWAEIRGRVGSLLEVGTGFHPELTGRENIFLNGAILGMKRSEIVGTFDEIVSFAEVEKFVDTPIKHYSSGMSLRLAFSVAAHLDPEILLVDEVLAVGDIAFQKKCVGKMDEVATQGRTVLFVSHNLAAVKELCQIGLVLKNGRLEYVGPAVQAVAHYAQDAVAADIGGIGSSRGTRWRAMRVNDHDSSSPVTVAGGESLKAEAVLEVHSDFPEARLKYRLEDSLGRSLIYVRVNARHLEHQRLYAGTYGITVQAPPLWLMPGVYTFYLEFSGYTWSGEEERCSSERVIVNVTGSLNGEPNGILAPPLTWSVSPE